MSMTVGSLFAGIGGLDLGLERAGMEVRWQVEIDDYCRKVLAKHWPDVTRYKDVRNVGNHNLEPVDLICGGFPCQDISLAGSGSGLDGERSGLWSEFARIIRELRPRFALVENVAALRLRGLEEWSMLSACSVGAPHMRRRLFVVAHADREHGRARIRDSLAQQDGPVSAGRRAEDTAPRWCSQLEDPSALYGGADGVPDRMDRNRAIGNAVVPQVAEWIGRRIMAAASATGAESVA